MALGLAGSLGCGQQQLGGGARDGGSADCGPLGKIACVVPTGCTSTTAVAPVCVNGSWTCPADVGLTIGCEPPICAASLPAGCTCDPSTGVTTCRGGGSTCPADAPDGAVLTCVQSCSTNAAWVSTCDGGVWSCPPGTMDLRECARDGGRDGGVDAEAKDAGGTCPPNGADGSFLSCVSTCNIDTTPVPPPACVNGAWICPSPGRDERTCCRGTAPPGCTCDPLSSVIVCSVESGSTAHGG